VCLISMMMMMMTVVVVVVVAPLARSRNCCLVA